MKNIITISMHGEKFYQLYTETTTAGLKIVPEKIRFLTDDVIVLGLVSAHIVWKRICVGGFK